MLAGQPVACTAGFYARRGETIVLTISDHCYDRAHPPLDAAGDPIGAYGADARRADCPPGRTCAGSDIVELVLAPDHIPWGHLNLVDLGAGGYRTIAPGARPLSCGDLHEGASVETNGRGIYRSGTLRAVAPYAFETDTIFPCMAVTDIEAGIGDSGGAVPPRRPTGRDRGARDRGQARLHGARRGVRRPRADPVHRSRLRPHLPLTPEVRASATAWCGSRPPRSPGSPPGP